MILAKPGVSTCLLHKVCPELMCPIVQELLVNGIVHTTLTGPKSNVLNLLRNYMLYTATSSRQVQVFVIIIIRYYCSAIQVCTIIC